MEKLLVILGPTATGKTELGLNLAKKFNGEIVSCDSRQVYVGLDIGTGKIPDKLKIENLKLKIKKTDGCWNIDGVNIWMYDVVSPKIQYTVADYVKDAEKIIKDIRNRGKRPIIVGGTGLYLKALLEGLPNLAIPPDLKLRESLQKLSLKKLQKKLQEVNALRWQSMNQSDRQNPRRLVRAIELVLIQNSKFKIQNYNSKFKIKQTDIMKIGLTAPRDILYERVDEGVDNRINQGMIKEAKRLHKNGLTLKRMRQLGLEYGVLADFLQGRINNEELMKMMQNKIHRFVRRQLTWFKKEKNPPAGRAGIIWFDITNEDFPKNVEKIVSKWYHQA